YLTALERLGMAPANISVILNKAEADTGLDPVDMAAELGRRFAAIVPYSRAVHRSVNLGVPVIVGEPRSPIAALLTTALSAVLPAPALPGPPSRRWRGPAPARPAGPRRRPPARPPGAPCGGRAPPRPRPSGGPGPPGRGGGVASAATRPPPAVVASGRPQSI